ncbi:hypothetical protein [Pigmentibacter ruber]|uniref:hypothetical protein n=1 Tax=Pigmentibacter ruber TaxID=2683196 RepID=UPI00131B4A1F|nr:hypothetical protein [Pigmentibacter ruber]BFD30673.1 hypothetical protein GTC16762_02910 [Pigmentibacter ruber]
MSKKIVIILTLVASCFLLGAFILYKEMAKNEFEEKSKVPVKNKLSAGSPLSHTADQKLDNSVKNKNEYHLSNNSINKNEPINIEQAEEEKTFWLEKIKRENAIERLNKNNLTESERQDYVEIYNRLSQLDSFIYKKKMDDLSEKVAEVESQHDQKLRELGISK